MERGASGKQEELARQLGEAVNYKNLFQASKEEERLQEIIKLLEMAGMDVTYDLSDTGLMDRVNEILKNFDVNKDMS